MQITDSTRIECGFEGSATYRTTFGAWLAANELDQGEPALIRAALERGETYRGGGGAAPIWFVRLA